MFLTRLITRDHPIPDLWVIHEPLIWQEPDGSKIIVPKGFITDLASIPKFLDVLPAFDREGMSRRPGALHDWLYATQKQSKEWADFHLMTACLAEGMSFVGAKMIYDGVHVFGKPSWDSDTNNLPKLNSEGSFDTLENYTAWKTAA